MSQKKSTPSHSFAAFIAASALWLVLVLPLSAAPQPEQAAGEDFVVSREYSDRFRAETKLVLSYMTSRHYGDGSFDKVDAGELIEAYMEDLDYAKLFFVQADLDAINARFAGSLKGEYLSEGNLFPAFEIFRLYRQRTIDRLKWVYQRLEQPFDYTTSGSFRPDREDLGWPKNQLEADELWEARLTFEMLDGILNGEAPDVIRDRLIHRYQRSERFLREMEPYDVEETFLNSFTTLFDPHSNFYSVESAENFSIAISNSLQGIGATLQSEDGYCVVRGLMAGSPAELSGKLNPGDKIVAVAQGDEEPVDVVDMKLTRVVKLIRGPAGSEVRLTIVPADDPSQRQVVSIIRDEIRLTDNLASAWLMNVPGEDGTNIPVGVIDLASFYGPSMGDADSPSCADDVHELLLKLKALGARAIVLDLRSNGGGLLGEAIRLTGLFIKDGPVVQVRYENGRVRTDYDNDNGRVVHDGPLVVLVSRNSASASEICAGALQKLGRAVIVGDRTSHGKGTVQQTMMLDDISMNPFRERVELGMVKITIQKFYLPDGASTQKEGVHSDLVLPSINELLPIGESDLDHALPWDMIPAVRWNPSTVLPNGGSAVTPELIAALSKASGARMASLPEFDYLAQTIARFRQKDEKKDISINLDVRRAERDDDKAFRERMEDWMDQMEADLTFPRIRVRLDLTIQNDQTHQQQLRETPLPDGRARAGSYYQKVYYHQDSEGIIHPVNVETYNFESVLRRASEVAAALTQALGREVSEEVAVAILKEFRNSDSGSDFNVEKTFRAQIPELDDAEMNTVLAAFFEKLTQIDPHAMDSVDRFDIHMREAVRVAADWVSLAGEASAVAGR